MKASARRCQALLETTYGIEPALDVGDFIVDRQMRREIVARLDREMPRDRESLWILEEDGELALALCLDDNLVVGDGADEMLLDEAALDRHCAVLEGVSHLLYLTVRARSARAVTLLELELQAEVDKFLITWTARHDKRRPVTPDVLWHRLFVHCRIPPRGCAEETHRYVVANRYAQRYCTYLRHTFFQRDRVDALWPEVRRFWRMGLAAKIAHIESG